MIIGINCIKGHVALVETEGTGANFEVKGIGRYEFSIKSAKDCSELYKNIRTFIAGFKKDSKDCRAVVVSCTTGNYGSSPEPIKAEALAELACDSLGIAVSYVKSQSFKSILGCERDEKWQSKAKELFNSDGKHKNFNKAIDGAIVAAYKEAQK